MSTLELAEFVLPGHPDRICDRIADLLVDAACARDPRSLVGVEVALHREAVLVTGCVTTDPVLTEPEVARLVEQALVEAGYRGGWARPTPRLWLDLRLEPLTDELRHLRGCSDDQAICVGWAGGLREHGYLPAAHRLAYLAARRLGELREAAGFGPDGKVLVAVEDGQIASLSVSVQHRPAVDTVALYRLGAEVARSIGLSELDRVLVNGGGDFDVGGPDGDNGLSGKKLVVDAYGPTVPIGGGAWCGKDPHKVDRLGALRARQLALRAVQRGLGSEARVELGWRPGDERPGHVQLVVDGRGCELACVGPIDLGIEASWRELDLDAIRWAERSDGSWFQRPAPWNPISDCARTLHRRVPVSERGQSATSTDTSKRPALSI